ncbi:histidine kinase [Burkholderia sp. HI2761]|uniref:Imm1 family immunity protein n=1 Tax=unclassified Burkholderia TaxID=2613784 RepID=UPI000B79C1D9|nr:MULTISPECIES: Imm1 family immunity protein [unclassified Burkholderia]MPV57637.1 histidine kinase [Burkholderia sp. BE24]OXJ28584.1 histidine kinase [Burkholderia sp. HI2761]
MRTTKVIEQTTVGNRSHVTEAPCDDSAQAITAVERLNGRDRSTVAFDASDATVMTIGGGRDGRYVVFIASEIDAALLNLTTPEAPADETIELVAGGQRGSYPARQCVDRTTATQAAAYFVSTGGADPRLCWQPG